MTKTCYSSGVPDTSDLHGPGQSVGAAPEGSFQSSCLNTVLSINLWASSLTQQTTRIFNHSLEFRHQQVTEFDTVNQMNMSYVIASDFKQKKLA